MTIARLARAFGCTMSEVRSMPYRDVQAMGQVLAAEQAERARKAARRKGR